jgi:ferredoxin
VVRVTVDESVCTGHGRCYALAPEVFTPDDYGHCALVHAEPGAVGAGAATGAAAAGATPEAEVPDALADAARLGRDNCPEQAITLSE